MKYELTWKKISKNETLTNEVSLIQLQAYLEYIEKHYDYTLVCVKPVEE